MFKSFRTDHLDKHFEVCHRDEWENFKDLRTGVELERLSAMYSDEDAPTPCEDKWNKLFRRESVFINRGKSNTLTYDAPLVKCVEELCLHPSTHRLHKDDVAAMNRHLGAMVLEESDDGDTYTVTLSDRGVFKYIKGCLSLGMPFRMVEGLAQLNRRHNAGHLLGQAHRHKVSDYARYTCYQSLQNLSRLMRQSWTYSLGLDGSDDINGQSLFDMRVHICFIYGCILYTLHMLCH
ncbi:hypothetical protein KIPB_004997 [Kipferlia bialata]|uniref:Uncharacterized protein n=1 Tax=Kipferlia bialata TaxID=797122 RepID=A0A391P2A6_9EUKA|nr:hypothetical protein KIPB_004997 [Kipferlia bialata]|eukprot:g4997.t1